jgi:hypothetical protein
MLKGNGHSTAGDELGFVGERLGSGDGEHKTLLTRQTAFEPLPASVLFALGVADGVLAGHTRGKRGCWWEHVTTSLDKRNRLAGNVTPKIT